MQLWDMPDKHIPLIMDIIDNIVSPDSRRRKYSWYVSNRDYDMEIGLRVIAYNLMVVSNIEYGDNRREIMKIVSC